MREYYKTKLGFVSIGVTLLLAGCTGFNGVRTPLYDGESFEPDQEKIAVFEEHNEVIGEEKDDYFRYPFSDAILLPTLAFTNEEPVLLREGEYVVGEDIPAGRVNLLGNQSYFQANENQRVRIGNVIVRDEEGTIFFENHFHSAYGVLQAQVDFHEGHTVEVIGDRPEITAFYEEELPEDPYILMDLPDVIVGTPMEEEFSVEETTDERAMLYSGIWEVGVHLDAGTYTIVDFQAPRDSELYIFHEGQEPRVIVLSLRQLSKQASSFQSEEELEAAFAEGEISEIEYEHEWSLLQQRGEGERPTIELEEGEKLYPEGTRRLLLERVE